jgi:hypothetical protein
MYTIFIGAEQKVVKLKFFPFSRIVLTSSSNIVVHGARIPQREEITQSLHYVFIQIKKRIMFDIQVMLF